MSAFDALASSGALEPVDVHLGRLLRRLDGGDSAETVALTAALLSHQRGRGHACVHPGEWAARPFPAESPTPLPALPELAAWERALEASPLVSDGAALAPLVRDAAGRLYLSRYFHAEQRLARRLAERLAGATAAIDGRALAPIFRALFPPPADGAIDRQAVAAAAALASAVVLVSGGPGTGKTTTVGRILALLVAADPGVRVALAAPTGKAAARLGEAIAAQVAGLAIDDGLRARIPTAASTLHRLLGYGPRRDRFRHHGRRPLACDALVIDEASMVDLLLMDAALDALPPRARVILLGDKDQLASVEAGFVFGDLCAAAPLDGRSSRRFADLFRRLAGAELPVRQTPGGALEDAAVELTTSYRFGDRPGLAELAAAIRGRDAGRALEVLDDTGRGDAGRDDVALIEPPAVQADALEPLLEPLDAYLRAASPAAALEALGRFRVLCSRRRGDWGVERLNNLVERLLAERGHPVGERHYPGRPILITANDYQVRLFNGDLGVCWGQRGAAGGRLWAWFASPGDEPRRLPLAKLPPHETAWAMTVHKAQGSEFDHVLLVLGADDAAVATRELLYTGATRARRRLTVLATPDVLRAVLARSSRRASGLAEALRAATGHPATRPAPVRESPERSPEAPAAGAGGQLSLFD